MTLEKDLTQKSFSNDYQRAFVNVLFTQGFLINKVNHFFKDHQITRQQYNVLRILRGQHPASASINLIKTRMMDKMSDASRIVERLRLKGLINRTQNKDDRRSVCLKISKKGLDLLKKTDEEVKGFDALMKKLSPKEIKILNALLDKIRHVPESMVSNNWAFNATTALMTSRDIPEEQLAWLGALMAQNPADASIRLEFILTALRHNELSAAMNAAAELDIDNAETQGVLFNQWDVEAGYLHAVTLANVYRQMNLGDDAEKLVSKARSLLADARRRGINSAGTDYLEATIQSFEKDNEGAFDSLNRSIERGWRSAWWTKSDPNLVTLRADSRFADVLQTLDDLLREQREKLDNAG